MASDSRCSRDLTENPPLAYLRAHAGQAVILTVRHLDGTVTDVPVTLRPPADVTKGVLGIGIQGAIPTEDIQRGPIDALAIGFQRTIDASTLILRGLQDLVRNLANPPVQGPVGMVDTVGSFRTQLPPGLPVLAHRGAVGEPRGRQLAAVAAARRWPGADGGPWPLLRRRITPKLERNVYLAGWVGLMAFLAWITLFDVRRLVGG